MTTPDSQNLIHTIQRTCCPDRQIRIMEICGTHTVALFRTGVKSLLPDSLKLISGPGCPVCVTSQAYLDAACLIAQQPDVTICTYGDMVRVPGRDDSLERQRARGADIMVVYSARDAVAHAQRHPQRRIVFLAVGFETTTPATAAAILEAHARNLDNFFIVPGHKLIIPALSALLAAGEVPIDGFICPGHVSVIIGAHAYQPIARNYHKPCVVTGFEPQPMLTGILELIQLVNAGRAEVQNAYPSVVTDAGNQIALELIDRVFQPAPTVWRGLGTIPDSGLELRCPYRRFDALTHFNLEMGPDEEPPGCLCGSVIQGKTEPDQCPLFARTCTPVSPVGPCMVSSEGTCAAWYKYNRRPNPNKNRDTQDA